MSILLAGIDLAWAPHKNGSAIAVGELREGELNLIGLDTGVIGLSAVQQRLQDPGLEGIAIDAPLIINNALGTRDCERQLNSVYRSRWAGCHPSNLSLYPDAGSVALSQQLTERNFIHLGKPGRENWQLECYPHPGIIELFGLQQRLAYKKGGVQQRRVGQAKLGGYISTLAQSERLRLLMQPEHNALLAEDYILSLKGQSLKDNEDALDAIICLYIAALYAAGRNMQVFGETRTGYIVVPPAYGT